MSQSTEHIIIEEEEVLSRVKGALASPIQKTYASSLAEYDAALIELRDEISAARLEDVPALVAQMERLQQVASRRRESTQSTVDQSSPYFGRVVLRENEKKREVLIGRGTFLDPRLGLRIVDWRDAPVSRLFYRYEEGDEYDEVFGGKEVEGEVLTRRSLVISKGTLKRIGSQQGSFIRKGDGSWHVLSRDQTQLKGGQGSALRPEQHHAPGKLGVGFDGGGREETFLPEITALIDARQFELITRPNSGLIVIQGGAGSGKTTIGLHRLAYLTFQDPKRFRSDRMLVVVFNRALARYISRVLPALGVHGVSVVTYEDWASKTRRSHLPWTPDLYSEETPSVVSRIKKHPAMLQCIDIKVASLKTKFDLQLQRIPMDAAMQSVVLSAWEKPGKKSALGQRVVSLERWLSYAEANTLSVAVRHDLERVLGQARAISRDVLGVWSELLTDPQLLRDTFENVAPGTVSERELSQMVSWCKENAIAMVQSVLDRRSELEESPTDDSENPDADPKRVLGVDGLLEEEPASFDREDDAILLRLCQKLRGPLRRQKEPLQYAHMLIDEAQDLSPVELSVLADTVIEDSLTLAGDVAQRMEMDNGFTDWKSLLHSLDRSHVKVEPLKLTYRSTQPIMAFSRDVLGDLAPNEQGVAVRDGAPVEMFDFAHLGDAVGFLSTALRDLLLLEPRSSIALIARYPEQADQVYQGLVNAEIPYLRRISDQDFPFKPGIDVTDVRQVKGLEWDYVILLEVNAISYPNDDEARHLLHIAATRAAHQLWVIVTGQPSRLLPADLYARAV